MHGRLRTAITSDGLTYNEALSTKTPRPAWHELKLPRQYAPDENTPEPEANPLVKPARKRVAAGRTGYFGVRAVQRMNRERYEVICWHNGKPRYVGQYDTALEGARAYNDYVRAHGLHKKLNAVDDLEQSA